jgi:hypothetical protein
MHRRPRSCEAITTSCLSSHAPSPQLSRAMPQDQSYGRRRVSSVVKLARPTGRARAPDRAWQMWRPRQKGRPRQPQAHLIAVHVVLDYVDEPRFSALWRSRNGRGSWSPHYCRSCMIRHDNHLLQPAGLRDLSHPHTDLCTHRPISVDAAVGEMWTRGRLDSASSLNSSSTPPQSPMAMAPSPLSLSTSTLPARL